MQDYIPSKSIFTELIIIYCKDCKTNHYVLTSPSCCAHKIEECPCNELQSPNEVGN